MIKNIAHNNMKHSPLPIRTYTQQIHPINKRITQRHLRMNIPIRGNHVIPINHLPQYICNSLGACIRLEGFIPVWMVYRPEKYFVRLDN